MRGIRAAPFDEVVLEEVLRLGLPEAESRSVRSAVEAALLGRTVPWGSTVAYLTGKA